MTTRRLRLAAHVRARCIEDQVILLDLRRGQYLGVPAAPLALLAPPVNGLCIAALGNNCSGDGSHPLIRKLVSQGLITDQPVTDATAPQAGDALQTMDTSDDVRRMVVKPMRVLRFLFSTGAAALSLRFRSLLAISEAVAHRRICRQKQKRNGTLPELRDAVAAFDKLRPLLFTSQDKCLFDSLALINFLASEGLFPLWIVGVTIRPFGAHSWVQSESMVLNDLHEHVRPYRPILVV